MGRPRKPQAQADAEAAEFEKVKQKRADARARRRADPAKNPPDYYITKTNKNGKQYTARNPKYKNQAPPPDSVDPILNTPDNIARQGMKVCGQPRTGRSSSGPGVCCMPAGHSTNHPGYGWCGRHLGNSPSGVIHALRIQMMEDAMKMYGEAVDISPGEAILEEVQRTAGHVNWLQAQIQMIGEGDGTSDEPDMRAVIQMTDSGKSASAWVTMYQAERKHLVATCKMALDAGVAERQVRIAEEQGMLLAMVIRAILQDSRLDLTPKQMVESRQVVRDAIAQVSQGPNQEMSVFAGELADPSKKAEPVPAAKPAPSTVKKVAKASKAAPKKATAAKKAAK